MNLSNINSTLFDNASHFVSECIAGGVHRASSAVAEQVTNAKKILPPTWRAAAPSAERLFGTALLTAGVAAGVFSLRPFLPLSMLRSGAASALVRSLFQTVSKLPMFIAELRNSRQALVGVLGVLGTAGLRCGGESAIATGEEGLDSGVPPVITQNAVSPDAVTPRAVFPSRVYENLILTPMRTADAGRSASSVDASSFTDSATPLCSEAPPAATNVQVVEGSYLSTCRVHVSFDRPNAAGRYRIDRYESDCTELRGYPSPLAFPEGETGGWDPGNLVTTGSNRGLYCYCVVPDLPYSCSAAADAAVQSACMGIRFTGSCDADASTGSR